MALLAAEQRVPYPPSRPLEGQRRLNKLETNNRTIDRLVVISGLVCPRGFGMAIIGGARLAKAESRDYSICTDQLIEFFD